MLFCMGGPELPCLHARLMQPFQSMVAIANCHGKCWEVSQWQKKKEAEVQFLLELVLNY